MALSIRESRHSTRYLRLREAQQLYVVNQDSLRWDDWRIAPHPVGALGLDDQLDPLTDTHLRTKQ